jgi:hypothetical protein
MELKWIEIDSKTFNFKGECKVFEEQKKRSGENFGTIEVVDCGQQGTFRVF